MTARAPHRAATVLAALALAGASALAAGATPICGLPATETCPGAENPWRYLDGPRLYLDVRMVDTTRASAGIVEVGGVQGTPVTRGPAVRLALEGTFGLWHDADADAVIDADEFQPYCALKQQGWFHVTLLPDGDAWGTTGVYVVGGSRDRPDDTTQEEGTHNVVSDAVADVFDDGRVDRLVASGPVTMLVLCSGNSGHYQSWGELILPPDHGTFGVTMTTDVVEMFGESVQDIDHRPAWT